MVEVTSVNGMSTKEASSLAFFEELKATNPVKRIPFETEPDRFTTRVIDMIAPEAMRKGLDVACSVAPSVPAVLRGDALRFTQVLFKLSANAVTALMIMITGAFVGMTLAVQAYNLASDERLSEAATASLVIVAVGILPLILLSRTIARARPGEAGSFDLQ